MKTRIFRLFGKSHQGAEIPLMAMLLEHCHRGGMNEKKVQVIGWIRSMVYSICGAFLGKLSQSPSDLSSLVRHGRQRNLACPQTHFQDTLPLQNTCGQSEKELHVGALNEKTSFVIRMSSDVRRFPVLLCKKLRRSGGLPRTSWMGFDAKKGFLSSRATNL